MFSSFVSCKSLVHIAHYTLSLLQFDSTERMESNFLQQSRNTKNRTNVCPTTIAYICYLIWQEGTFWNQTFEEAGDGDIQEIRQLLDEDKPTQDKGKETAC